MAYLGREGLLLLKRAAPEPVVVPTAAINKTQNYITVEYDDWLLGEEVYLIHSSGVISGFAHRDELDRIYLHETAEDALINIPATRYSFSSVSLARPVVLAANINYVQAETLSAFQYTLLAVAFEKRLISWPSVYAEFVSEATANPWQLQGNMRSWELSRSAPELDIGSLGDKFATFMKNTVSGSGTMDFVVDLYSQNYAQSVDPMLRLVQLTEAGSNGTARFHLKQSTQKTVQVINEIIKKPVNAAVYFKAEILITSSSISTSAQDLIYASADFVTTGPIRLLSS